MCTSVKYRATVLNQSVYNICIFVKIEIIFFQAVSPGRKKKKYRSMTKIFTNMDLN